MGRDRIRGARSRGESFLVALLALAWSACASGSSSEGCPRSWSESGRRCKRECVVSPGRAESPIPCHCMAECLCWQMSGHPARSEPEHEPGVRTR